MDDVLFSDGFRRLKISFAGVDRATGKASAESFRLAVYAFEEKPDVRPLFTFNLDVDQAARLHSYLEAISIVRDRTCHVSGRFIEIAEDIPRELIGAILGHPKLLEDPDVVRSVLELNPGLCRAIIETELTTIDVQSLAYRRAQLQLMSQLLSDQDFFRQRQEAMGVRGKEAVWQRFFEENQWIFGFALHYVVGEGAQPHKLEQVVAGHSIASSGKRTDALLRTRGLLRSLCYVEIKTHETKLLHSAQYRPAVWRPSDELVGAVAQSHKTVQMAIDHISSILELPRLGSYSRDEQFFNYAPRAVVVCGALAEFEEGGRVDIDRFSSFELYRRNVHSPDIITFDELHERASAIVEAGLVAREPCSGG